MESQFQNSVLQFPIGFTSLNSYRSMEFPSQSIERQYDLKTDVSLFQIEEKMEPPIPPKPAVKKKLSEYKSHSCYVCGKVLSSTSSYYVHMKQHSGHKPYHCPLCDVSFCRKPYLEVHMRTHTGERPFQCNVCLKRFTQKSSLNIHKRAHTGERPYSCDICDKKFAVKSYVDAHRWTHVFEKPLSCDKCQIPFNSRSQYVLHMRSHSTSSTFECACGRTFTKDSYLIRHQIKVHGTNDTNSVSELTFNHVFISDDSLDKKDEYEINSSPEVNVTHIESDDGSNTPKIRITGAPSMPSISPLMKETLETFVQNPSDQLAKL